MVKKVFIVLIVCIMLLSTNIAIIFATNVSSLEQEKNNIDKQISEKEKQIQQVEEEKSSIMQEVQNLTAEITSYELEIDDLNTEINQVQAKIAEAEVDLKKAQEQYDHQNEMLQKRLVAMYEAGETTYLDVLLSSQDISDFIDNYYIVSEITALDTELLDQMEKNKINIEGTKKSLEDSRAQIEELKNSVQSKANQLKSMQQQKQTKANQLTQEEQLLQKELDQYEEDKKDIQRQINSIVQSNPSNIISNPGTPSSYGYVFPVQGLSVNNINNKSYPSYAGHTGTDININVVGKNVVAVKDGTVEISTALYGSIPTYNSSGTYLGSYRSYGEYILINHHDGTMTLYGHLYPNSRRVSKGDKVVQGQVIGVVGNTGNCKPRPTPSSPLNGTHLHFEVRLNGKCVNPIPYLR